LPKQTPAPPAHLHKRQGYIQRQIEKSRRKLSEVKAKEERKAFLGNKGKEKEVLDIDQLVSDDDNDENENNTITAAKGGDDAEEEVDQLVNDGKGEDSPREPVKTRARGAVVRKENLAGKGKKDRKKNTAGVALEDLFRKFGRNKNNKNRANKKQSSVDVIDADAFPTSNDVDAEGDTDGEEEEDIRHLRREISVEV